VCSSDLEDLNTAQTLANLYNQGYTQAAGFAQGLPAQQLAGASALAGYGQQALGNQQSYAAMLQGAGQAQRGMAQQNLDLAYKDFLEQRGFPQQQLQTLLAGASGLPSPITQTTTAPGQSTLGQVGSAASAIGTILDLFKKG
jgi:hypothetical protein